MTARFRDGIAVVTGAAQGIGEAIARRMAFDGARVVVADIDAVKAEEVASSIDADQALAVRLDVTDPASFESLNDAIRDAFGEPYRYLVSNAGIQTFARAMDVTSEDWNRVLDVNARGTFLAMQSAGRVMPPGSAIVAMSSIQGRLGGPFYPHYSASKAAVLSLVKSFALELAPSGIRVNSVAPGVIATPLWDLADREMSRIKGTEPGVPRAERIKSVPLGRAGTPEDVAAAASFLLSDDASYITGECLHVCGGDVMI